MPFFHRVGDIPRRRHTAFRSPEGELYYEQLMGEEGFSSDSSLLYHRRPPTRTISTSALDGPAEFATNHPLRPRLFQMADIKAGGDPVLGRHGLVGNSDIVVSYVAADEDSALYRNVRGDELWFVEEGEDIRLETSFGVLTVGRGDYVVVPCGTVHQWRLNGATMRALVFESRGHIKPPSRFRSDAGQFIEDSPYCELDFRVPEGPLLVESDGPVEVLVRNHNGLTRDLNAWHPFDVVGWFGCFYPYALSIYDYSPITGRFHRPPPVHQVFEAPGAVICNFVPRLLDWGEDAIKIPAYHSNVDSDEILFYAEGDFFSRRGSGIRQASVSLHPGGVIHGPHPGSLEPSFAATRTEEYAVMLDTFAPLLVGEGAAGVEDPSYEASWLPADYADR